MDFNYTPKSVMALEKESGMPLTDMIQTFSVSNLVMLVKHGFHIEEDAAFDKIEDFLSAKEGNDTVGLFVEILKGLQSGGFLPRSVNLDRFKTALDNNLEQVSQLPDSGTKDGKSQN